MRYTLFTVALASCAPAVDASVDPMPGHDSADPASPDSDGDGVPPAPGPGVPSLGLRRLSRAQLDRAVSDLLGVDAGARALLPDDPDGAGFDATAATLDLPPTTLAAWRVAVEQAARQATLPPRVHQVLRPGADADLSGGTRVGVDAWEIPVLGGLTVTVEAPTAGLYVVQLDGDWTSTTPSPSEPALDVGGVRAVWEPVAPGLPFGARSFRSLPLDLEAGQHAVDVRNGGQGSTRDPLLVREVVLEGPIPAAQATAWTRWVPCSPDDTLASWRACATQALTPLARRAWRRSVTADELDRLLTYLDEAHAAGLAFHAGLRRSVEHVLLSPHFLFRVEAHDGTQPTVDASILATRLAFFLWSSGPDDVLLDAAEQGRLAEPAAWEAQVDRMLADPRAEGLVQDFTGQWLGFRELARARLDATLYPEWTPALAAAMQTETASLAREVLRGVRPLPELLTASRSHLEPILADLYELPAGPAVEVADARGGGVLGHASVHVATSHATRTSIVKRGEWVLGALLCSSVGPPPGDIPPLSDLADPREDVALHASKPTCAACHDKLDPAGLALEHFGPTGRWRDAYPSGVRVDAHAILPDGTEVYGAGELGAALAEDPRFTRCATQSLVTWALGRAIADDDPALDTLHAAFEASGWRLPALVHAIVAHPLFHAPLVVP